MSGMDKTRLGIVAFVSLVLLRWLWKETQRNRVVQVLLKDTNFRALVEKKERLRTYKPFWLQNGFLQTILFNYFMPAPKLEFEREIVAFPDGGSSSIDWYRAPQAKKKGNNGEKEINAVCLLFPALGTSCRTKYIRHLCKYFAEQGYEIAIINMRGAAGTPLTSHVLYDLGKTEDVELVVEHIEAARPGFKLVAVGASMGSNILVRYLCSKQTDHRERHPITAAVSISNPFHLYRLMQIEQQFPFNLRYFRDKFESRFVEWFKRRLGRHEHLFRTEHTVFDFDEWLGLDTIDEFSEFAGKHVFGYESFQAFLEAGSCYNYLETLQVPTLFIQSFDDPIVPRSLIPEEKLAMNSNANVIYTDSGGHIAFLDKHLRCWFLPLARAFLHTAILQDNKE